MRVSFIDDEPEIFPMQYGGKARTIVTLARTLLQHDHIEGVNILSQSIDDPRDVFDFGGITMQKLDSYNAVAQIAEEVNDSDVVSVHTCSFTLPRFVNRKAALVYSLHDVMLATADKGSHLDKALAGDWDAIVSPSEFATGVYKNFAAITGNNTDVYTIPRGIDSDIFKQIAKEEAIMQLQAWDVDIKAGDGPIIFVPNRVNAGKGEDYLQDICERLSEQYPGLIVLTTFEPEDAEGTPSNVRCVGWLETEKLKYFYSSADATLCLSKLPESFSQVCTESITCGAPIVAFEFGNLAAFARDLPAVVGCEPSPDAVVESLREILNDHFGAKTRVRQSQEIIKHDYDNQLITNRYIDLYKSLIKAKEQRAQVAARPLYFASPFLTTHGTTLYLGNDTDQSIKAYSATTQEREVLEACARATTIEQLCLTTSLGSETITEIIGRLVNNGLIVGGHRDTKS